MLNYYVYIPNNVKKIVKKIPNDWRLKIMEKLRELETNQYLGVHMQGKYSNKRKITIWPYRIIYLINEGKNLVEIFEIERRGSISYDR
jgi:mRNA-degrading endonuclease RelE of RelBE toxin-antitoxin system